MKHLQPVLLGKDNAATETKKFISLYKTYRADGAMDDQQIFEVALKQMQPDAEQQEELYDEDDVYGDIEDTANVDKPKTHSLNPQAKETRDQKKINAVTQKKKSVANLKVLFGK